MEATIAAEQRFGYTCGAPHTSPKLEELASLEPTTLALMHGPAHTGPAGAWLNDLAAFHGRRAPITI